MKTTKSTSFNRSIVKGELRNDSNLSTPSERSVWRRESQRLTRTFQKLTPLSPLFSKSSVNGKNANYISEDDFEFPKLIPIRAQTAPPRPLTEIEEFRRSPDFLLLENTVMMSDHLK